MNRDPRKLIATLGLSLALVISTSACADRPKKKPVEFPKARAADCDLDDLREGDDDCKDARRYQHAINTYGANEVWRAEQEYLRTHPGATLDNPLSRK